MLRRLAGLGALLWLAAIQPALAGRDCDARPADLESVRRGLALAASTMAALDASASSVVVIARAGQDLSRHGLRWSHIGFAYRIDPPATGAASASVSASAASGPALPHWRVIHKLNTCGTGMAAVYRQGLAEFFNDDPERYEAALLPLSQEIAGRILPVLLSGPAALALDEPSYSMVAYPWAQRYQQSNQWAIETLAFALDPDAKDRIGAQRWLEAQGYRPTVLKLPTLQRLGARMTRNNVAFDDHPAGQRFAGRIATITADSVMDWLVSRGLGTAPTIVR